MGLNNVFFSEPTRFNTRTEALNEMIEMLRSTFSVNIDFGLNDRNIWIMWETDPVIVGRYEIIHTPMNAYQSAPAA